MTAPWKTGRGFAPPAGGDRGWWLCWGWFGLEVHPRWWRLGLSMQPWVLGVCLGPLVLRVGRPTLRFRVRPATGNAGMGDHWQDHNWTVTVTTGASNQEGKP